MEGILVANKSLLALSKELKSEGINFIFTTRLQQDVLESSFSLCRRLGNYKTHPSPCEFLNRLRTLTLNKNINYLLTKQRVPVPVDEDNWTGFVTSEFISDDIQIPQQTVDTNVDVTPLVLSYIAGWSVRRQKEQYSFVPNCKEKFNDLEWIRQLTLGKLVYPTETIVEMTKNANEIFEKHHGTFLKRNKPISSVITSVLEKYPNYGKRILKKFVKARTYARIWTVNLLLKIKRKRRKSVRAYKQLGQLSN